MKRRLGQRPYHDLGDALSSYWDTYGGWRAFLKSPFTHAAIALELLCYPIWMDRSWPDIVLTYLPPLLGFAIAGYALVFAFGDDLFRKIMAGAHAKADQPVFYEHLSATYLQFVLVQVVGIVCAIVAKADVGRWIYLWLANVNPQAQQFHDVARNAGLVIGGLAFFPSMLAVTNAAAAALVINSVIDLYVKLYHTPAKVEVPQREPTEV